MALGNTTSANLIVPELFLEAVAGALPGMSVLGATGAVRVETGLPGGARPGSPIHIPYFGTLGEMRDYADGDAIDVQQLAMTDETASVVRSGIAFNITDMARRLAGYADPYGEAARQFTALVARRADKAAMDALNGAGLPTQMVLDVHSSSSPVYLDRDLVTEARLRWRWREREDWALFLDQWPCLKLLLSDLGTDLVGAANLKRLAHQADLLHERMWWTEEVFTYLSRREQRRAAEASRVLDRATRPVGPGRRAAVETLAKAEARRAPAEEDLFCAVRAEQLHIELFSALAPDGRRWSEAQIEDHFTRIGEELSSLPEACREQILRHLTRHRARWTAHRVLWELLEVKLREGSALHREQVLDAAVALWWSEHRVVPLGSIESVRASREAWSLRRTLDACCESVTELMAAVSSLIERPRRSSSLVEALNSRRRVLLMAHRNVSDHLLALVALRWNLSARTEGRRRGTCPFVDLGIDFADGTTPWYEPLLKEVDAG